MLPIYCYVADVDHFESLAPKTQTGKRLVDKFRECQPLKKIWKPLSVSRDSTMGEPGDFGRLTGCAPVFSQRAWDVLQPLMGESVETLPIDYPGDATYLAINVLDVVEGLDLNASKLNYYSSGKVMSVASYVFDESAIRDKHMFRIPETKGLEVLVSEQFVKAVKKHKLQGAVFRKVNKK